MNQKLQSIRRRTFLKCSAATLASGLMPRRVFAAPVSIPLGNGELTIFSDGHLSLSPAILFDGEKQTEEAKKLFDAAGVPFGTLQPPINITLWRTADRLVLFDVGSGSQFMDTAGLLPLQLEEAGIDPADITDVVFTHAHPDHCWGLLDDFDELLCPNATYHMHGSEYDYWMSEDTLNNTPEEMLGMVAGARNRLPLIEEQIARFNWGDEVLPGIEAVDTHGHTPGHTSFTIHQGSESILVLGDALTNVVMSFARPKWPWRSDVQPEEAIQTRVKLLDRLASDQTQIIGYHLPASGVGSVEREGTAYRFLETGV